MDFRLSTEQQALADSVARFCSAQYDFPMRKKTVEESDGFSRKNWKMFAELGWLGAGLAEAEGGFGGTAIENAIIMELFGRSLVVEPLLSCAILALQTLAALPAGGIRDGLIESAVSGRMLLAVAHGEPAARGDGSRVQTQAIRTGNQWIINGHKSLVLGAPSADRFFVSARAAQGIGLFMVARDAANMRLQPYRMLDNHRAADIWFNGTLTEAVLAEPGSAETAIAAGFDHAMIAVCAEAVGAMDAAISMTRDYIKTRRQFGTPLSSFQALQHRMADMLVKLELSRSILYQGLAAIDRPEVERRRPMAAMKAVVSAAAMFVGRNAVQLHGGIGMTEEYAIGHYYRRLFVIAALFGSESWHLSRFAACPGGFWQRADG